MATTTQYPATVDVDIYNAYLQHNMWPPSAAQVKALEKKYKTTDQLQAWAKTLRTAKTLPKMPAWAVKQLYPEVGNTIAYMQADPSVAKLWIQSASEGWDADKLHAALDANKWWSSHSQQQLTWLISSNADRNQMRQQAAQQMADQYFTLYGEMKPASAFLKDANVDSLASGQINQAQWLGMQRQTQQYKERYPGNAARAAAGLPMLDETQYRNLEEQYKAQLGQAGYDVSKLQPTQFTNFFARDMQPDEVKQRLDAVNTLNTNGSFLRQQFSQMAGLQTPATAQDMYGLLVGIRPDLHQQYAQNTKTPMEPLPSLQTVTNALTKAQSVEKSEFNAGGAVEQPTATTEDKQIQQKSEAF